MTPFDWEKVRRAGAQASLATTPGGLWRALLGLFDHSPYAPLPEDLKAGTTPEAALAVLIDGLRDGVNAVLERDEIVRSAIASSNEPRPRRGVPL